MTKVTKLTPVEWEIMEAIWTIGGAPSVREVLEHSFSKGEKAYTTIQTIMKTLEKKGVLKSKKIGLVNFFKPTRSREKMVKIELSLLLKRAFHGSIPTLANYLLNSDKLTLKEIETIKELLKNKETELRTKTS